MFYSRQITSTFLKTCISLVLLIYHPAQRNNNNNNNNVVFLKSHYKNLIISWFVLTKMIIGFSRNILLSPLYQKKKKANIIIKELPHRWLLHPCKVEIVISFPVFYGMSLGLRNDRPQAQKASTLKGCQVAHLLAQLWQSQGCLFCLEHRDLRGSDCQMQVLPLGFTQKTNACQSNTCYIGI